MSDSDDLARSNRNRFNPEPPPRRPYGVETPPSVAGALRRGRAGNNVARTASGVAALAAGVWVLAGHSYGAPPAGGNGQPPPAPTVSRDVAKPATRPANPAVTQPVVPGKPAAAPAPAGAAAPSSVPDVSTPKKALYAFFRAKANGDIDALRAVTIRSPQVDKVFAGGVRTALAAKALNEAAVARFGIAGRNVAGDYGGTSAPCSTKRDWSRRGTERRPPSGSRVTHILCASGGWAASGSWILPPWSALSMTPRWLSPSSASG